jgi:UDP-glucose 4-epimerase
MAKIIIISGSGYIANSLILYLKKYNYLNIIQLCRSNPSIENIKIIQTENYLDFDFESYNEVTLIYTNGLNQLECITKKDFANYIASELPVLLVKKLLLFTNKVNLIYFSSVNVYNDGLIDKGVYFESSNLNSKEVYGMSKISGETILLNNTFN